MRTELTSRQKFVLAVLAAERGAEFAPVQVQKLFFVLDENVADAIGGRQFAFEPYDYGPFDKAVYQELEALECQEFVSITYTGSSSDRRRYALTPAGQELGRRCLENFPEAVSDYVTNVSKWVRSLSFAQLVGSIYRAYPQMRANSIFQD